MPFTGGVTAGVHNERANIFTPLRWMTKMTAMTKKLKTRPRGRLPEFYRKLVILVMGLLNAIVAPLSCSSLQLFDFGSRS